MAKLDRTSGAVFAAAFLLSCCLTELASAKIIRFAGDEQAFAGYQIYLENCPLPEDGICLEPYSVLIGEMNDAVSVSDGVRYFNLYKTNEETLTYKIALKIDSSQATIIHWNADSPCRSEYGLTQMVSEPVPQVLEKSGVTTITFAKPVATPTLQCADPAVIAPARALGLKLETEPTGAEFWFNGKRTEMISGKFYSLGDYQETYDFVQFLFRKNGFANCFGFVEVAGRDKLTLSCQLEKIPND